MSRDRALRHLGVVILGANVILLLAKGLVWYQSGSLAVGSEAVNSLTDAIYSLLVVGGLLLTARPPDFDHPHGHERIEPFVSLVVVIAIVVAGGVILWGGLMAIHTGEVTVATGPWAVAVLAAAAAVKYVLYRYAQGIADRFTAPSAHAIAVDSRNDVLTAVAALVGVAGAQAGLAVLDPVAAMLVAVVIIHSGIVVGRRNLDYLVGAAPPASLRERIVNRALEQDGVEGVHDVLAHYVGPEVDVSLHVEVEEDLTLAEGHEIEVAVIEAIMALPEVDDVFVHLDPKDLDEWKAGTYVVDPE